MTKKKCHACETGWRHADEVDGALSEPGGGRLVPCPVCKGSGWLDDESPAQRTAAAE